MPTAKPRPGVNDRSLRRKIKRLEEENKALRERHVEMWTDRRLAVQRAVFLVEVLRLVMRNSEPCISQVGVAGRALMIQQTHDITSGRFDYKTGRFVLHQLEGHSPIVVRP